LPAELKEGTNKIFRMSFPISFAIDLGKDLLPWPGEGTKHLAAKN